MKLRDGRDVGDVTVKDLNKLMDEGRFPEAVTLADIPLPLPQNSPLRSAEMAFFCEVGPQADATVAAARAAVLDGFQRTLERNAQKERRAQERREKTNKPNDDYGYGNRR